MKLPTTVVLAFVALSHLGFLMIEILFCSHPFDRKTVGRTLVLPARKLIPT